MEILFQNKLSKNPKVSFILLDWSCRESFHIFRYLSQQNVPRDTYEILWIEYYNRRSPEIREQLEDCTHRSKPPILDQWIVLDMPETLYYHKHLMYNIGIILSKGEIVTICDSDAMVRPTFVESIINSFQQDPNIALHMDEVRNNDQRFYPFNYPSFDEVEGEGAINFENGTTTGLRDKRDPLHTLNYGACLSAWRDDLIAIGGADEHLDYLGHVCGPYELTFRLSNLGKREIWHSSELLYHVWHPGQAGHGNYVGPHDGRHVSSTALRARETGRVQPLLENKAIRALRINPDTDPQSLISELIDPTCYQTWSYDALSESTSFYVWETAELLESLYHHNIVKHGGLYYGLPQVLGPVDLNKKEEREHPDIMTADSHPAIKHLIEQKHLGLEENRSAFGAQVMGSFLSKAFNRLRTPGNQCTQRDHVPESPPILLESHREYNLVTWRGKIFGLPYMLGEIDLNDHDIDALPDEIIVAPSPEIVKSLIDDLKNAPEGQLIEEHRGFNIIKWGALLHGVPQFVGPVDQASRESPEGSLFPRACTFDRLKGLIDEFYQQRPEYHKPPVLFTAGDLNHPSVLCGEILDELIQNKPIEIPQFPEMPDLSDFKNSQNPAAPHFSSRGDEKNAHGGTALSVEYIKEVNGYSLVKYQDRFYGVPQDLMDEVLIRD